MEPIAAKKTSGGEQNTEIVEDENLEENLSAQITAKTDDPQNLSTATPSKKSKGKIFINMQIRPRTLFKAASYSRLILQN